MSSTLFLSKTYKIYHISHWSVQFRRVKYIHIVVRQISTTFSSCRTEAPCSLNNSFYLFPSVPGNLWAPLFLTAALREASRIHLVILHGKVCDSKSGGVFLMFSSCYSVKMTSCWCCRPPGSLAVPANPHCVYISFMQYGNHLDTFKVLLFHLYHDPYLRNHECSLPVVEL